MAFLPFGSWAPDQPDFGSAGATEARNCIRTARGYRSIRGLRPYSRTPLPEGATGLFYGKDTDGNVTLFAGTGQGLWRLDASALAFGDASKPGGYGGSPQDRWRTVRFGEDIIATNGVDPLQRWTLGGGPTWADLADAAPRAKFIAAVRDFVMVGNTFDPLDGARPWRVRWSALGNPLLWEPSQTTQADWQDIADAGAVQGVVGGDFASILMEHAVVRATYVGTPLVFQFDKIEGARGCYEPNSVVASKGLVIYYSDDGWQAFDGTRTIPIGAEKIDRWFAADMDEASLGRMSAAIDPTQQCAFWLYAGRGNRGGTPNRILIYNYQLGEWSYAEAEAEVLGNAATPGYTLDNLDDLWPSLDDLPAPLDSRFYKRGAGLFAAVKDGLLQTFTGPAMPAVIETAEQQLAAPNRALITSAQALVEADGVETTLQVGTRVRHGARIAWGRPLRENRDGYFTARAEGRFHRVRANIVGEWTHAQGVNVEAVPTSFR